MSKDSKILLGVCLVVGLLMLGAFMIFNKPGSTTSQVASEAQLVRADSYTAGTGSATVVEFADFQCPACQQAAPELMRLKAELGSKVKVVFRHFPLPSHRHSQISAHAGEAAGEQGKFWEMYEILYQKQSEWSNSAQPLDLYKAYAEQLGLDVDKFASAVTSKKFQSKIDRDLADAAALGVDATPTVYVNGKKMNDFPSYENVRALIR